MSGSPEDDHLCICGRWATAHPSDCYLTDESHTHVLPLCCENCPCLSVEEAHPESFGTLIEDRLPTRIKTILAKHGIHTMERLEQRSLDTSDMRGIGNRSRWQIYYAKVQWWADVRDGKVERKPLPEAS